MKRRLISTLLAALILVGLLPVGAMHASAESALTISKEAVALLKQWEGFDLYPRWDNSQYTVGYGTRCDKDDYPNGITVEEAEALLQEFLTSFEEELNRFADKNGLTLNQNQFDALMLFSFNVGTGWMYGDEDIRTAVISGMTGNDFILYLTRWSKSGNAISTSHIKRRLAEADVYLNGYYAKTAPDCFTYVLFNGNGGTYNYKIQGYDASDPVEVKATASMTGYPFLGWYTAKEGGRWITTLDSTTKGLTLYARWQDGQGNVDSEGNILGTAAEYERITNGEVNAYSSPSADAGVVSVVAPLTTVTVTADYMDAEGVKWGKLADGSWINLNDTKAVVTADPAPDRSNSVTLGSGSSEEEEPVEPISVAVTVTSNTVNFRSGPGTGYSKLGTLSKGKQLIITEVANVGGTLWGKFNYGWVCLMYTNYNEVIQQENSGNAVVATGTVISNGALRIRAGAGTGYATVGTLNSGSKVKIYEIVNNGSTPWGRISTGWICLTYVNYTMGSGEEEKPDEEPGETPTEPDTEQQPSGTPVDVYGWVTAVALNVRDGAGVSYEVVTRIPKDTYVHITELINIGGTDWGKVPQGWICMDYVLVDSKNSNFDGNNGGTEETPGEEEKPDPDETPDTGETTGTVTGVVTASNLCVRTGPGTTNAIVTTIPRGTQVTILEQTTVNGVAWGKIENGWICMSYVKLDPVAPDTDETPGTEETPDTEQNPGTGETTDPEETPGTGETTDPEETPGTEENPDPDETPGENENDGLTRGVVTASNLCVRSAPGTANPVVTTIPKGTEVTILQQTLVNGTVWGRIENGWICMTYVNVTSTGDSALFTGMVTASSLCIRSAAGTSNAILGTYSRGTVVEILEVATVNGTTWGRTVKGWICMDYVQVSQAPEQPGNTDVPGDNTENGDDDENSGDTGADDGETPSEPGESTEPSENPETPVATFDFTDEEYIAALTAELQDNSVYLKEKESAEENVRCFDFVTASGYSYGVAMYLEVAEDGESVTGIAMYCGADDETGANNFAILSAVAMLLVDDTITDADLNAALESEPELDSDGSKYYVMERESGAFIYMVAADVFGFFVYPVSE